jgi:hypothetical protein
VVGSDLIGNNDYLSVNVRAGQEVFLHNLVFASLNYLLLKVNATLCMIVACHLAYTEASNLTSYTTDSSLSPGAEPRYSLAPPKF